MIKNQAYKKAEKLQKTYEKIEKLVCENRRLFEELKAYVDENGEDYDVNITKETIAKYCYDFNWDKGWEEV